MIEPHAPVRRSTSRRLLVVSPWGLAGGYSGPLTLMDRLFSALADDGAEIDVIYRDRGDEGTAPEWATRLFPIALKTPYSRIQQIRWGLRVRKFLREHGADYDVVHLHGFYLGNQVAIAGVSPGASVVALPVLDDGDLGRPAASAFDPKRVLLKSALKYIDVGFALSPSIAAQFRSLGLPASSIQMIANPADQRAFDVGARRQGLHEPIVLGFVGKVGGFKNPDLVLRALREGLSRGCDWSATFVGPFPDEQTRTRIEALVDELELAGRTTFTGFTTDVASSLASVDVFVLPSSQEGLPGALCEAMAAALPCIVTDVGSMADHVRAADAGIVVEASADDIAMAVTRLVGPEWQRCSTNAHDYALDHFDSRRIAHGYAESAFSRPVAGVKL